MTINIPIDPALLEAGDHHDSTVYQHERVLQVICGEAEVEVMLTKGHRAVEMEMEMAAQIAATEDRVVTL